MKRQPEQEARSIVLCWQCTAKIKSTRNMNDSPVLNAILTFVNLGAYKFRFLCMHFPFSLENFTPPFPVLTFLTHIYRRFKYLQSLSIPVLIRDFLHTCGVKMIHVHSKFTQRLESLVLETVISPVNRKLVKWPLRSLLPLHFPYFFFLLLFLLFFKGLYLYLVCVLETTQNIKRKTNCWAISLHPTPSLPPPSPPCYFCSPVVVLKQDLMQPRLAPNMLYIKD